LPSAVHIWYMGISSDLRILGRSRTRFGEISKW
jgi:hypothetical protein